ncbi:glycosyltransferase family 2 protein [Rugamonas apoptosis]|uniref:Glycosyltransferase family 2 protein n=1 Tax=Rugamonas apoptosis TaxID=2758570 RepID=A0A7W2FED0_9BURK|nr:glycosyltransferase family 2 protein [Rugamonas apoptosis]MBA5690089.1 glycosyltransferase family 2 protein [Rugamonas apoptosis]
MMLCSVIIPLYNKAPFIEAAIASILAQQHQAFEIIVVDDGSQDEGPALVRAIADPRLRLIQIPNGGVANARNVGIAHARGELVCFLDADDWYRPAYLATQVAMAQRHPSGTFYATAYLRIPDGALPPAHWPALIMPPGPARGARALAWCQRLFTAARDGGRPPKAVAPGHGGAAEMLIDDGYRRLRYGSLFFTGSVAVRRDELLRFAPCFPVGESMGEDLDLWFRLMERMPFAYCPTPLVAYRVAVSGSLVSSNPVTTLLPALRRLEQRVQRGEVPPRMRAAARWLVADARISVARTTLLSGQRRAALADLLAIPGGVAAKRWWVTLAMCLPGGGLLLRQRKKCGA